MTNSIFWFLLVVLLLRDLLQRNFIGFRDSWFCGYFILRNIISHLYYIFLSAFTTIFVGWIFAGLSCCVSNRLLCCNEESISFCLVAISSFRILFSVSKSFILSFSFSLSPSCCLMVSMKFLSNVGSISFECFLFHRLNFKFSKPSFFLY